MADGVTMADVFALAEQNNPPPESKSLPKQQIAALEQWLALVGSGVSCVASYPTHGTGADAAFFGKLKNLTPLCFASGLGRIETLLALLKLGVPIDEPDSEGNTALHHAVVQNQCEAILLLMRHGASISVVDQDGNTALHLAAGLACLEALALLLNLGADLQAQNKGGMTPLHLLSFFGKCPGGNHHHGIDLLLARGADPMVTSDSSGPLQRLTPMAMAGIHGHSILQYCWPTMPHKGLLHAEWSARRSVGMLERLVGTVRQVLGSVAGRPLFYWVFFNWAVVYTAFPALAVGIPRGHSVVYALFVGSNVAMWGAFFLAYNTPPKVSANMSMADNDGCSAEGGVGASEDDSMDGGADMGDFVEVTVQDNGDVGFAKDGSSSSKLLALLKKDLCAMQGHGGAHPHTANYPTATDPTADAAMAGSAMAEARQQQKSVGVLQELYGGHKQPPVLGTVDTVHTGSAAVSYEQALFDIAACGSCEELVCSSMPRVCHACRTLTHMPQGHTADVAAVVGGTADSSHDSSPVVHCWDCGYCVGRFDHHCPWLGVCIGQDNHPFFLVYIYAHTLACIVSIHLLHLWCSENVAPDIQELTSPSGSPSSVAAAESGAPLMLSHWFVWVLWVDAWLFFLFGAFLVLSHTLLAARSLTLYERECLSLRLTTSPLFAPSHPRARSARSSSSLTDLSCTIGPFATLQEWQLCSAWYRWLQEGGTRGGEGAAGEGHAKSADKIPVAGASKLSRKQRKRAKQVSRESAPSAVVRFNTTCEYRVPHLRPSHRGANTAANTAAGWKVECITDYDFVNGRNQGSRWQNWGEKWAQLYRAVQKVARAGAPETPQPAHRRY
jgi:hypothetical protein